MQQEGQYAIRAISAETWLSAPITSGVEKRNRKQRSNKQLVHPIFLECSRQTDDPWWSDKFLNAAYGKMPSKFFNYKDGLLFYSKRNTSKVQNLEVPSAPYEAFHACKEFFMLHGNLVSDNDIVLAQREQKLREEVERFKPPSSWSEYTKIMKEILIDYYVMDMTKVLGLQPREEKALRQKIIYGLTFNELNPDCIELENGRILNIKGLCFNSETRAFSIEPNDVPVRAKNYSKGKSKKTDLTAKMNPIDACWLNYLINLSKRHSDFTKSNKCVFISGDAKNEYSQPSDASLVSDSDMWDCSSGSSAQEPSE